MHSFSKFWKTNEIWINQIKNTEMDTMMCDHRNNLYRQKQRTWTIIIKTEIEQISIGAKKKPTMTQSNEWDKMVFWICFHWILSTVIERTNCLNGVLENKLNGFCASFEFKSNILSKLQNVKSPNWTKVWRSALEFFHTEKKTPLLIGIVVYAYKINCIKIFVQI